MTSKTLESLHRFKASGRYDAMMNRTSDRDIQILPLEKITPDPDQPRKVFDEAKLKELSSNIKVHGVLQAIMVQPSDTEGMYKIIMGERRYRASLLAGLESIPAVVKEATAELRAVQLSENIQRQELTTMEIARAIDHLKSEGRSRGEIAQSLGWSTGQISYFNRVLKMPSRLQDLAKQNVQVKALCVLQKLWGEDQASVEVFIDGMCPSEITRVSVEALEAKISRKRLTSDKSGSSKDASETDGSGCPSTASSVSCQLVFLCEHGGAIGRLLSDRRASSQGSVVVSFEDGERLEELAISSINLVDAVET